MTEADQAGSPSAGSPPEKDGVETPTVGVEASLDPIERQEQRVAAVGRLISAAARLANTISLTEELAQQRADIALRRSGNVMPMRNSGSTLPIISLAEAARRTGRHPEVLRRWCAEGRIPAMRIGRSWMITPETLAVLLEHSSRSRPRFAASRSTSSSA